MDPAAALLSTLIVIKKERSIRMSVIVVKQAGRRALGFRS